MESVLQGIPRVVVVGLVGRSEDAWAHRWAGIRMRLLPPESNSECGLAVLTPQATYNQR